MKGFLQEYGIIMVVVAVVLGMLAFGKTGYAKSIQDAILGSADHIVETGENITKKEPSSMLINGESFQREIPSEATSILFTNEKAPKGISTVDLTQTHDGDVVGWLDGTTWKVSTQDYKKEITFNKNSSKMFDGNNDLTNISFDNIDTSNVTNMIGMFRHCSSLTFLNLSNFDTSKVTDMSEMFLSCYDLTSLNLSNFNTSNVTNMSNMLYGCHSLTSLDITNFNTFNVTDMSDMFNNCFALTSLDITRFNTTNVTNMGNMFYGCRNLQEVDLSDLDTSNVTDMSNMFYHCYKLTKVKTSQVTYNNMNSLAEKNNKEVQDYIQLNQNKIEIVNK